MRKLLDLMKTPLIIPIIFVIMYCIVYVHTQLPRYSREKIDTFDEIREEFYLLNDYIMSEYDGADPDDINIVLDKEFFYLWYFYDNLEDKNLPDEIQVVVKHILDWFSYDNIYIEVSEGWIAYSVAGYDKYLFSKNGNYVKKDFQNETKGHFSWFVLKDGWYWLESWAR